MGRALPLWRQGRGGTFLLASWMVRTNFSVPTPFYPVFPWRSVSSNGLACKRQNQFSGSQVTRTDLPWPLLVTRAININTDSVCHRAQTQTWPSAEVRAWSPFVFCNYIAFNKYDIVSVRRNMFYFGSPFFFNSASLKFSGHRESKPDFSRLFE